MEEMIKTINDTIEALKQNLADYENGKGSTGKYNKAAGARARKLPVDLEKLLKQFRKESVKL